MCHSSQPWLAASGTSVRVVVWALETGIATGNSGAGKWALQDVSGESDTLSLQGWGKVPRR